MDAPAITRAYSLLHVKALDVERRTIAGLATSPEPDRMGDVIEPLGVEFANPIPLLLYHDSKRPVGMVTLETPTRHGIEFTAHLPIIPEAGLLRDRIEEAWQSIKAKLITGVSIGFRALEHAMLQTGGVRFLKSEVVELSLVTVPANARATIHTIKSLDCEGRPRPASPVAVLRSLPGASGSLTGARAMKTTAEQISGFSATREAKVARMAEIMTKAGDEGVTLDAAQTEEYDRLQHEAQDLDAHLARLVSHEEMVKRTATVVRGETLQQAAETRSGNGNGNGHGNAVIRVTERLEPGIEFARYVQCLAACRGNTVAAHAMAQKRFPDQPRIQLVLKAAVDAGTTTDPAWAGSLTEYTNFTGDFIEFLRPQTIVGKFGTNGIPRLTPVPFNVRIMGQTSGGAAYWVGEGKPKPLTKFDFAPVTFGQAKLANIAVITEELARASTPSAEQLVRNALGAAIAERMDIDFVDPAKAAVANVSPASITNGIAPIVASLTGDIAADVKAIMNAFIAANITPSEGVWIMPSTLALQLSLEENALGELRYPSVTMNGGTFMGLPVIVSKYVAADNVILANASDIYLADDGQVVIDASREASLEMSDAPTNTSDPAVGAALVSMFQTNSIALRAERFINWQKRRAAAVQWLDGVTWATAV